MWLLIFKPHRSEGTLSLSEVPFAGGSLFGYFFGVWKK
jgi:hypothetical protein